MGARIALIADLGESFGAYSMGDDEELLKIVTGANIACGFHAGDPRVMDRTVRACVERGVGIGAHPSFPDLVGFGRRAMDLTADEVRTDVLYQLGALAAFAASNGTKVTHLTPHGKLGNLVITRPDYAEAMVQAAHAFDPGLIVVTQDGEVVAAARQYEVQIAMVGVIDRNYEDDGALTPRGTPDAVLHDPEVILERTLRMVTDCTVVSRTGTVLPVRTDAILLHGDGVGALDLARRVRAELISAGAELTTLDAVMSEHAA